MPLRPPRSSSTFRAPKRIIRRSYPPPHAPRRPTTAETTTEAAEVPKARYPLLLKLSPAPTKLSESRGILRELRSRYGRDCIEFFVEPRHTSNSTNARNYIFTAFNDKIRYEMALNSSPMTIKVQSSDVSSQLRTTTTFSCSISPSTIDHYNDMIRRNPFFGPYTLHHNNVTYQTLQSEGVPARGFADLQLKNRDLIFPKRQQQLLDAVDLGPEGLVGYWRAAQKEHTNRSEDLFAYSQDVANNRIDEKPTDAGPGTVLREVESSEQVVLSQEAAEVVASAERTQSDIIGLEVEVMRLEAARHTRREARMPFLMSRITRPMRADRTREVKRAERADHELKRHPVDFGGSLVSNGKKTSGPHTDGARDLGSSTRPTFNTPFTQNLSRPHLRASGGQVTQQARSFRTMTIRCRKYDESISNGEQRVAEHLPNDNREKIRDPFMDIFAPLSSGAASPRASHVGAYQNATQRRADPSTHNTSHPTTSTTPSPPRLSLAAQVLKSAKSPSRRKLVNEALFDIERILSPDGGLGFRTNHHNHSPSPSHRSPSPHFSSTSSSLLLPTAAAPRSPNSKTQRKNENKRRKRREGKQDQQHGSSSSSGGKKKNGRSKDNGEAELEDLIAEAGGAIVGLGGKKG